MCFVHSFPVKNLFVPFGYVSGSEITGSYSSTISAFLGLSLSLPTKVVLIEVLKDWWWAVLGHWFGSGLAVCFYADIILKYIQNENLTKFLKFYLYII